MANKFRIYLVVQHNVCVCICTVKWFIWTNYMCYYFIFLPFLWWWQHLKSTLLENFKIQCITDIVDLVPDHCNEASHMKCCFFSTYESYVYTYQKYYRFPTFKVQFSWLSIQVYNFNFFLQEMIWIIKFWEYYTF